MIAFADWAIGLAQFLLVTGLSFAVLVLLASYLRYERLVTLASDPAFAEEHGDTAFRACIARRLGAIRRAPFVVLWLEPDPVAETGRPGPFPGRAEISDSALTVVRSRLRRGDDVVRVDQGAVGLVVDAPLAAAAELGRRLMEEINRVEPADLPDTEMPAGYRLGAAAFPEHGGRGTDLVAAARAVSSDGAGPVSVAAIRGPAPAPPPRATPDDVLAAIPPDQRSLVDAHTGFLAAAYQAEVVRKRIAECRRQNRSLVLACFELVHYRQYRDHDGACTGDAMLGYLGSRVQAAVRESDLLARLDGDRFLAMLDCGLERGEDIMARVQQDVASLQVPVKGGSVSLDLAVGLAGFPAHGRTVAELCHRAQAALEVARGGGGHRRAIFDPAIEPKSVVRADVNAW
jgi:diguanylate cyclase (GGDEF)-like protein